MSDGCGNCGQVVEWVREIASYVDHGGYNSERALRPWAHSRCVGSFEMHAVVEVVR